MTLVANQKEDDAVNYLRQVQDCARTFASYHKPWLNVVSGDLAGSGAAMAAQAPFTVTNKSVKWWMNEAKYGFVPHGGY